MQLKIASSASESLDLFMVVVLHVCDPVCTQPIDSPKAAYEQLSRLELADLGYATSHLEIDLLIGSEKVVTGRVLKGDGGPTFKILANLLQSTT